MTRNQGEGWSSNDEPAILNGSWYDENDYFSYTRVIPAGWGEVSEGNVAKWLQGIAAEWIKWN